MMYARRCMFAVLPVHLSEIPQHWTLALFLPKRKQTIYTDSLHNKPSLLYERCLLFVQKHLFSTDEEWPIVTNANCPLQLDGFNCGLHVVHNAMAAMDDATTLFHSDSFDPHALRIRMWRRLLDIQLENELQNVQDPRSLVVAGRLSAVHTALPQTVIASSVSLEQSVNDWLLSQTSVSSAADIHPLDRTAPLRQKRKPCIRPASATVVVNSDVPKNLTRVCTTMAAGDDELWELTWLQARTIVHDWTREQCAGTDNIVCLPLQELLPLQPDVVPLQQFSISNFPQPDNCRYLIPVLQFQYQRSILIPLELHRCRCTLYAAWPLSMSKALRKFCCDIATMVFGPKAKCATCVVAANGRQLQHVEEDKLNDYYIHLVRAICTGKLYHKARSRAVCYY